jgi:hypothetical protein
MDRNQGKARDNSIKIAEISVKKGSRNSEFDALMKVTEIEISLNLGNIFLLISM